MKEHYVTLFDSNFLVSGLCLHESLQQQAQPFHLWVVCMDKSAYDHLKRLGLPDLSAVLVEEIENDRLRAIKPTRTKGEYCWTITPFVPELVFNMAPEVTRVTYLDADLFLFDSPQKFFDEFEKSEKHVLITEHAYAPEYVFREPYSGRFCVQFMTFNRTDEASEVMHWWQERCLEWCYARFEPGRFGDQKYLDLWPTLFGDKVHILDQKNRTLAPWNVEHMLDKLNSPARPVIYHFHAMRILSRRKIKLYESYCVGKRGLKLYAEYLKIVNEKIKLLEYYGIPLAVLPEKDDLLTRLRNLRAKLVGKRAVIRIDI